jgi:glycosyltransferase involved in cell wall biosynthesis
LERQNCHTAYAYRVVEEECRRIGVVLPEGYEHVHDAVALAHELREYEAADYLLCPSEFVKRTFVEEGFDESRLLRHRYGYDPARIRPGSQRPTAGSPLVVLYAGLCSPRKGLHHALRAWLDSSASQNGGRFLICGEFAEPYREHLKTLLSQPGVEVLGHRKDLPELMRQADLFVLPSLEEGSALVTYEARGAGCVLMVSDAAGAVCEHRKDGLIHATGDVAELTRQFDEVQRDRAFLATLRDQSLAGLPELTWSAAGVHLADLYRAVVAKRRQVSTPPNIISP